MVHCLIVLFSKIKKGQFIFIILPTKLLQIKITMTSPQKKKKCVLILPMPMKFQIKALQHGPVCFSIFDKIKFQIFLEF